MQMLCNSFLKSTLLGVVALSLTASGIAQVNKVDPTGAWAWSFTFNNNTISQRVTLKLEGEKLTGVMTSRGGAQVPIQEAKLEGDEISFQVTREREGSKVVSKYHGKISGDAIKGKTDMNFGGEARTREWEAKRIGKGNATVTGTWKYTLSTAGGQTFEAILRLTQDGQKLTGAMIVNQAESPISDGRIRESELSFKVERQRDGQTFLTRYFGRVEGDIMKGRINSNWGGSNRTYEFQAKRVTQ